MANNPLDTNEFSFWLRFNSLSQTNWYQISEPIGFDGAKFVIEQESQRFARSVKYGAIDKLKFLNEKGEKTSTTQVVNPQGDISDYLDYGFEWLSHTYSIYGFESDVDLLIRIDNIDFQIYGLNFKDKDITDKYTYFQCNLIDNSKVADYKRRMNDTLNAFSDKGVFQQTVVPIQSFNYLKRAVPQSQTSNLTTNSDFVLNTVLYGLDAYVYNPCIQINTYGVLNTLTSFEASTYDSDTSNVPLAKQLIQERTIVKAKKRITNLKIDILDLNYSAFINTGFYANHRLRIAYGNEPIDDWTTIDLFTSSNTSFVLTNQNYSVTIPYLEIGQKVWLYFSSTSPVGLPSPTPITNLSIIISNTLKINLYANSLSLDTVVKAVRYVDLIKQGNKMVHNLPFNAPKFDVNGQFYDQAVFNKRMVAQNTDFLYFKNKDIYESTDEVCADVEISENEMYIGQYEDYYTNDEIGIFSIIPDESTNIDTNDRFACNKYIYNYNNFANDRTLINTSQSFQTESEWKLQNTKVENSKEIKNDLIRDSLAIQDIIDLEVTKPTTSTDEDFKLCIEDIIQLAPNSFGQISAILLMRVVNGRLEILNRDSEGDSGDTVINWLFLGLAVGSTVQVLNGTSAGMYTVYSITSSVLVLTPTSITLIPFSGDWFISMKYYYQNIAWQTRTNQGFSLIDGVSSQFGNLRYTIKRNILNYWLKYLSTMLMYSKKDIINSFFKSNGALKTQLTTETVPVIENATILYSDLPTPILTGNIINLTVYADYNDVLNYMNLYKTKKGFVRCLDLLGNVIKGYVQKSEFLLSENKFTLTLEEKFELQTLTLIYSNGILTVNDVTYNLSGISNWWKTQNDYIQFFDNKNKPICNLYRYNFINLNGVTYSSINDLVIALNSLP